MLLVIAFIFVMGLVWGSFLNVVIYRMSHGISPAKGRSICPKCKKEIPWKYNIPLLSFIWLRGRCANCHKKISWRYPAIELLTGILFIWWYAVGTSFFHLFGNPWQVVQPIFWLIVGMILLTIFMTDLLYGVIPLSINLTLFSLVLFYRISLTAFGQMTPMDLFWATVSGIVLALFFLFLQKITKIVKGVDGMGDGDIFLSPSLGLLLGWPKILIAVFLSFTIGSIVGIVLMMMGKKKMSQTIPFGPFLVIGTVAALVWGGSIWTWYTGMLQ